MSLVFKCFGFAFLVVTFSSASFSQQGPYSDYEEIENVAAVNGFPSMPGQGVVQGDLLYSKIGISLTSDVPDTFFVFHAIYNNETDEVLAASIDTVGTHAPGIASAVMSEVHYTVTDDTVEFQTWSYVTSTNTVFRQIGSAIAYLNTFHHRWN